MKRFIAGLMSLVVSGCLLFSATPVLAQDPFSGVDCKAAASSSVCTGKNSGSANPLTGPNGLIRKVTRIIAVIAGIASVIIILVGSFMYVTAGSDTNKVAEARKAIIYALVGLVVIIVAQSLILYILSLIN